MMMWDIIHGASVVGPCTKIPLKLLDVYIWQYLSFVSS
jgi:hypothetical protein